MNCYAVWYAKNPTFEVDVAKNLKSVEELKQNYARVKLFQAANLDDVFAEMQGENWSSGEKQAEAQALIRRLGLRHTSMSVGDIIYAIDGFYVVANFGFDKLEL